MFEQPGVVVHACNPATPEAGVGERLESLSGLGRGGGASMVGMEETGIGRTRSHWSLKYCRWYAYTIYELFQIDLGVALGKLGCQV